jgi:hypothetical protein
MRTSNAAAVGFYSLPGRAKNRFLGFALLITPKKKGKPL